MSYPEFISFLNRLIKDLKNEEEYYKIHYTYFVMISPKEEINLLLKDFFVDLIDDSEKEESIVALIRNNVQRKIEDFGESFFEGSPDFILYENLLKRINNSSRKRASDAYPVINYFYNLIFFNIFDATRYKTLKRKKYLTEKEYHDYIDVLNTSK